MFVQRIHLDAGQLAEFVGLVLGGWKSKRIMKAVAVAGRDFPEGYTLEVVRPTVADVINDLLMIWAVRPSNQSLTMGELRRKFQLSKPAETAAIEQAFSACYGSNATASVKVAGFLEALADPRHAAVVAETAALLPATVRMMPGAPEPDAPADAS